MAEFKDLANLAKSQPRENGEITVLDLSEGPKGMFLNLRRWYDVGDGTYRPTRQGISLTIEEWEELRKTGVPAEYKKKAAATSNGGSGRKL